MLKCHVYNISNASNGSKRLFYIHTIFIEKESKCAKCILVNYVFNYSEGVNFLRIKSWGKRKLKNENRTASYRAMEQEHNLFNRTQYSHEKE